MSKPKCKLIGENGNIFNLMALARKAMDDKVQAKEMCDKIMKEVKDYEEALMIIAQYVEVE